MNINIKLKYIVPVLIVLWASNLHAQSEIEKNTKDPASKLVAPSNNTSSETPKFNRPNQVKSVSAQDQKKSTTSTKTKQTFTGTGPAMARDNPDA